MEVFKQKIPMIFTLKVSERNLQFVCPRSVPTFSGIHSVCTLKPLLSRSSQTLGGFSRGQRLRLSISGSAFLYSYKLFDGLIFSRRLLEINNQKHVSKCQTVCMNKVGGTVRPSLDRWPRLNPLISFAYSFNSSILEICLQ